MKRLFLVAVFGAALLVGGTATAADSVPLGQEVDPDDVLLSVAVEADGDATWTVEYRTRLDTDESERAFEEFRADLESDPGPYRQRFHNRMNATAADASEATGREMAIENVSVSAERRDLPQEYGVVTYTLTWTNFAAVDGDRLVVGDAIDSLFLDEETTLLVEWPDDYALVDATPEPSETRDSAAVWNGPTDFGSGEPRLTLARADGAADDASALPTLLPFVAAVVVLGGAAVALAARRDVGPFGDVGGESSAGGAAGPAGGADAELLSNEEQVLRLLDENGGRMKQADVAEALGWTDAKTSQVTSGLREQGELEAFRLGRENVLERPDDID